MRILHVTPELAPRSSSGMASYVWNLAREQGGRHWPAVFTRFADASLPEGFAYTERRGNVTVRHLNRLALEWSPLERSYIHHAVEQQFREFLGEMRSDVVHVHGLEFLGLGLLDIAQSLKIKTVFTAHDFWPMCPVKSRRCRTDGLLCETIDLGKCGACVLGSDWEPLRAAEEAEHEKLHPRSESFPELYKRHYGQRFAVTQGVPARRPRALLHAVKSALRETKWKAQEQLDTKFGDPIQRRRDRVAARLRAVDLVLAPSEYVRDQYIEHFGLSSEKVICSELCVDGRAVARVESPALRIGYVGRLSQVDGVRLLLDAFCAVAAEHRELELHLHGEADESAPGFVDELVARAAADGCEARVRFHGRIDGARLVELFSGLDVAVFPSLALGNAPLELQQAARAGVAVLVSDRGGLVEFVRVHGYGRAFAQGSVTALAGELRALASDRARLRDLSGAPPRFKTLQHEAAELVLTYHQLLYGTYKAPSAAEQAALRHGDPLPA